MPVTEERQASSWLLQGDASSKAEAQGSSWSSRLRVNGAHDRNDGGAADRVIPEDPAGLEATLNVIVLLSPRKDVEACSRTMIQSRPENLPAIILQFAV